MVRTVPAQTSYFGMYEVCASAFEGRYGISRSELPQHAIFISGVGAGVAFWTVSYPLDVVKTAMQTDSIKPEERQYRTLADCIVKLWNVGGVRRFFAGYPACITRAVPAAGGFWIGVENTRRALT
eukprot:gnl/MRDRNA2_/MRDRNA2_66404_c0_seq2.p2 gnl/MRDRNA2_/MRDRNA2_66404_c0~~gnl/MRDRNA2_/MRDRNA2_66404_c0_seq2.p2  ORF type:complete len:125 (-),score=15.80 gnl/MRDRNA2_/MRDRNA2_66404_c0_seq2:128-502(-)